jgi:PAS domain S-box-containing protein
LALSVRFDAAMEGDLQILWEDNDRVFCRGWRRSADGRRRAVLAVLPAAAHPSPASLARLAHEYELKDELDDAWAVRPLALERERGRTVLLLEDPGGEPLDHLLDAPMEIGRFLSLAIGIGAALGKAHQRGFVHKDLKPAHILVNRESGEVRLTGFGIASRLSRERQAPEPPEFIAGTLAYMAPEQTGRMNRSIDARSDLYALGITFYRMLTGTLPFTASDPMEWVHCHIAKKPVPPAERLANVPAAVSAITMKLLVKNAEERYQTAAGVERDLRRCLTEWESRSRIDEFPVGEHDTPDRLLIPEKLYGREREIEALLAAFDRVAATGMTELVLVSGYSGIGKSAVVHELHRVLVPPRGLFAAGKFDQYKRDIPYATLAQAFQALVRQILGKSDAEVGRWRDALQESVGPNGQLMVTLIPELELIIGKQSPVPELPLQDAQHRFQMVFQRVLGVFARPEHPLALFLDDLQWLDAATLALLEYLATRPEVRHLLLVSAYRDNEVGPEHPLMRMLAAIRRAGSRVQEIVLAPLGPDHMGRLIADALHCEHERAAPLARLVEEKTTGNPFFVIQFLTALAEEGLFAWDGGAVGWSWDLGRIRAKGYTDNVVELVIGKLSRLPDATQDALKQLACLGNVAETAKLGMVYRGSEEALHTALWEAVRAGLIFRQESSYTFLHDRVQEAAYALIPEGERAAAHLVIGRVLASRMTPEAIEENIFEIVSQLNRGATLIASVAERERVAELNLIAGKRAKASTAYNSALAYLAAGCALLPEDRWERRPDLTFALDFHRAECEFLTGALAVAEQRLSILSSRAGPLADFAAVTCLRLSLYTTLDRSDRAVEVCLDYLRRVGVQWSAHPTRAEVRQEYERMWRQLGSRPIEGLLDLPPMTDPQCRAILDVLVAVQPAALFTDENLLCLVTGRMANLSLEHGNSDGSCFAYVWLGAILGWYFGDYGAGFRFGKLGVDLVEQRGLDRFKARVCCSFANVVSPWTCHARTGLQWLRRAFDAAHKTGDLTFAAYAHNTLITFFLVAGDPLGDVQREAEKALAFARNSRFGLVADLVVGPLRLVRTLRGLTPDFASFNDAGFDEDRFEQHLEADPRLAVAACRYSIRKVQARFFAADHVGAVAAAAKVERLLWTSLSFFEAAEYHFYGALARAALCDAASAAERTRHLETLAAHHRQLEQWAVNCPQNFENRAALVGAEIARLEGRDREAMDLYEQAIRSAQANGFVHNEALANELAARFYAARGFERFAHVCLQDARYGYVRWGADGKVRQLDQLYPQLREVEPVSRPTDTIGTPVEHLDLATVLKVSQAVSSEIVLERLLDTLMRRAIEHAGAQRGLLIVPRGTEQRIAAEATTRGDTVSVHLYDKSLTAAALPESILHYVLRTGEAVILDDAAADNPFAADAYLHQHCARSILCLPLINQSKLIGVLYLENNLASHVFTPARLAVLKLLASQAAVALENTRLYRDVVEREARIRRLVDANIIGIYIWDFQGRIIDANEAFLDLVGYSREDLISGRLSYPGLTPSEWNDVSERARTVVKTTGTAKVFEKEYLRKDGSRVPILLGGATFGEDQDQGVAFVLDLTERKQAEAAARGMQLELAHANRVATIGQLTASIAHEVRQPIAATATNAAAALRWLGAQPPNLEEARQALDRIVNNAMRAGDIIERIRDLIQKAPPGKDGVDINEAIGEVIELTRGEAVNTGVSVQTQLAVGLPLIHGDRVQLQQVSLNLIINAIEAIGGDADAPRELLISTEAAEPGGVLVSVRDSGPGLAPAALEHLFEAFYTTKPSGLGLGLSICQSIIEAHGGRLWVSANVPRGAIFHFTVPAHSESAG